MGLKEFIPIGFTVMTIAVSAQDLTLSVNVGRIWEVRPT